MRLFAACRDADVLPAEAGTPNPERLASAADFGRRRGSGRSFFLGLADRARGEFKTDFAFGLFDEEGREGPVVFLGNEFASGRYREIKLNSMGSIVQLMCYSNC